MGLQGRSDWLNSSSFIQVDETDTTAYPWFRSPVFKVPADVLADVQSGKASALLHVASFGFHQAYWNGIRLENSSMLIPSISMLNVRVLSHTYDVGPFLSSGSNAIGVWSASPGWSAILSPGAKIMAELRVFFFLA